MARKGVGAPLDKGPVDQLTVRSNVFSKTVRDNNTLLFLTGNKPWIRLSSSVNELDEKELREVEENGRLISRTGNATLAKKVILGNRNTKGGLGDGTASNPTYKKNEELGFRPEPGITSANIKSKGSYGTLRETTVNFIVWTLEDLEEIEKLYLRPGYSMLLEWGHSLYLNTEGELQKLPGVFNEDFFTSLSTRDIESRIEELRENSAYNYDAVFGYVKNYNWSFRKDGGYDCSISIASKGTLIESLRVDVGTVTLDAIPKEAYSTDEDTAKTEQKSPFHFFFSKLNIDLLGLTEVKSRRLVDKNILSKEDLQTAIQVVKPIERGQLPQKVQALSKFLEPISDFTAYRKKFKDEAIDTKWWIPLRTFLEVFNQYVGKSKFGENRVEFYTGQGERVKAYLGENKLVTSNFHFALDPLICILPGSNNIPEGVKNSPNVVGIVPQFLNLKLAGSTEQTRRVSRSPLDLKRGGIEDILNIYVCTDMLKDVIDSYIDTESGQLRNAIGMIKDILSKINDNLGGVNELDVHYEDAEELFYIVDRKNTPESEESYPVLNLTGLSSTLLDLQISSKLSNQVGAQIAIAAQGISENYTENISELLKWNTGLVDRHTIPTSVIEKEARQRIREVAPFVAAPEPEPIIPTAGSLNPFENTIFSKPPVDINEGEKKFQSQVETWLEQLDKIYKKLIEGDYDSGNLSEMKSFFRTYMSKYVLTQQITEEKPEKGIIPIELSLTMLGISGITIAKAFKVAKGVLPSRITDNFGFIITGLEHSIGAQWTTTIRTQFYTLGKTERVSKALEAYARGTGRLPGTNTEGIEVPGFDGPTPNADRLRRVLKTLGYNEKGKELSNGGDMSFEAVNVAIAVVSEIKAQLPGQVITLTAGNDLYHQKLTYTSRHKLGNAFDIVLSNPTEDIIKKVERILFRFTAGNKPNFRFLNEYVSLTKAATGKHFHISWGPGTEGNDNIAEADKLVSQGLIKPIRI